MPGGLLRPRDPPPMQPYVATVTSWAGGPSRWESVFKILELSLSETSPTAL